ncbi:MULTISPECIES: FecCD family ABC transporter permease [unclassified Roseovarius]|uniref:FecCD family ABC transporter permease n=1 Tax=unclassified Roseovarius TaxID=2614913 RepID=UPI00273F5AF2|nr:iron chelate uptake ABC transporter family permease subunit [Roseovarius sp. MMSF_3350]
MMGLLVAGVGLTLVTGPTMTPPSDLLRVLSGHDVPGASFSILELRLPRATLSILAGMSFGLGGVIFQTLLRNPLASPDIIGISAGASAAAVFAIVVLGWSGLAVSVAAVVAGMIVALLIYLLAWRDGVSGARLILIGIGISAMLDSMIAYVLSRAPAWSLQDALRWLTGSVNGATLSETLPVLLSLVLLGGPLLARRDNLEAMRLGDDAAAALGVPLRFEKLVLVMAAVGLIAVATAVSGPVAFVAFLSGPIAARIAGTGRTPLLASTLVGALLVLLGDYAGQHLLAGRYPVGVITGALGAPYLVYLIIRSHRSGGGS